MPVGFSERLRGIRAGKRSRDVSIQAVITLPYESTSDTSSQPVTTLQAQIDTTFSPFSPADYDHITRQESESPTSTAFAIPDHPALQFVKPKLPTPDPALTADLLNHPAFHNLPPLPARNPRRRRHAASSNPAPASPVDRIMAEGDTPPQQRQQQQQKQQKRMTEATAATSSSMAASPPPTTPYRVKADKMAELARMEAVNGGAIWQAPPPPYQPGPYQATSVSTTVCVGMPAHPAHPISPAMSLSSADNTSSSSSPSTPQHSPSPSRYMTPASSISDASPVTPASSISDASPAKPFFGELEVQISTHLEHVNQLNVPPTPPRTPSPPPVPLKNSIPRKHLQPSTSTAAPSPTPILLERHESRVARENLERRILQLEEENVRREAAAKAEMERKQQRRKEMRRSLQTDAVSPHYAAELRRTPFYPASSDSSSDNRNSSSGSDEDNTSNSDASESTAPTVQDSEQDDQCIGWATPQMEPLTPYATSDPAAMADERLPNRLQQVSKKPSAWPLVKSNTVNHHGRSISVPEPPPVPTLKPTASLSYARPNIAPRSFSAASWVHARSASASATSAATAAATPPVVPTAPSLPSPSIFSRRTSSDSTISRRFLRKATPPPAMPASSLATRLGAVEAIEEQEEPLTPAERLRIIAVERERAREKVAKKAKDREFYDMRKPAFWGLLATGLPSPKEVKAA